MSWCLYPIHAHEAPSLGFPAHGNRQLWPLSLHYSYKISEYIKTWLEPIKLCAQGTQGFITISISLPKKSLSDLQLDIWPLVQLLRVFKKDLERELISCNHLKWSHMQFISPSLPCCSRKTKPKIFQKQQHKKKHPHKSWFRLYHIPSYLQIFCSNEFTTLVSPQWKSLGFFNPKTVFKHHPSLETLSKPSGTRQQRHHIPDNTATASQSVY